MLRSSNNNNFSQNANTRKMASSSLQEQDPLEFPDNTCKIFFQLLVDNKSADQKTKNIFSRILNGNTSAIRYPQGEVLTLTFDEVVDCKGTFRTALGMQYADHLCKLQA